jgi:hypothetical protein
MMRAAGRFPVARLLIAGNLRLSQGKQFKFRLKGE